MFAVWTLPNLCQHSDQVKRRPPGCDRYDSVQIPAADLPTAQDRETVACCEMGDKMIHAVVAASRNLPSRAAARNCGIGSSSLNADVNAFDRLHMVRGWNSSCCGSK
jgi:hypothetical protein